MINIENSLKLYEILESSGINPNQCPPEVTYQMLEKELMCADLENADPKYSIDELWTIYYYNHKGSDNIFGFTTIHNTNSQPLETIVESSIEEPIGTSLEESIEQRLSQISRGKSKRRQTTTKKEKGYNYNISINNNGSRNTRSKTNTRKSHRGSVRGSVTRRNNPYIKTRGGGKLYDTNKANYCDTLNKSIPSKKKWYRSNFQNEDLRDFTPHWPIIYGDVNERLHTLTKLKKVNGTNLYVYGTSHPMNTYIEYKHPDIKSFQAVNNMLFYRYVKGISRIIDLHGCSMNWDLIEMPNHTSPQPYRPSGCKNSNEKRLWRRITRSDIYENNTKKDDDVYSRFSSFYWIDMSAGFFDTYHDIMKFSFDDPKIKSIVHCKAGFGRTGTVLLMIICKYYFNTPDKIEEFKRIFDFPPNDTANKKRNALIAVNKLYKLLESHVELDLVDRRKEPCLRTELVDAINIEIRMFDKNWILHELFRGFYDFGHGFRLPPKDAERTYRRNQTVTELSLTNLNVLITRINYILYFIASYHKIESVNLYELYSPYSLRTIQRDIYTNENVLSIPCLKPRNVMVGPFTENTSDMFHYLKGSQSFTSIGLTQPPYKMLPSNSGNMGARELATQQRIRDTLEKRRKHNEALIALRTIEEEEKEALKQEERLYPTTPFINPRDIINVANNFKATKADKFRTQPSLRNPTPQTRQNTNRITKEDKVDLTDVSF
jgi:hypothetical protein